MGQAKKEMMRREELHLQATEIAVDAGVLRRCEWHEDVVLDTGGDPSDAYRLGNARFSRGEAGDFRSRREQGYPPNKASKKRPVRCSNRRGTTWAFTGDASPAPTLDSLIWS